MTAGCTENTPASLLPNLSNHDPGFLPDPAPVKRIVPVPPLVYGVPDVGNDDKANDQQNEVDELLDIGLSVHIKLPKMA
jgi:hypothetical protein